MTHRPDPLLATLAASRTWMSSAEVADLRLLPDWYVRGRLAGLVRAGAVFARIRVRMHDGAEVVYTDDPFKP